VQIEHPELPVAQPLVAHGRDVDALERDFGRLPGAQVGRHDHDIGSLVVREVVEPPRDGLGLLLPGVGQRHVGVALGDVDQVRALLLRGRCRDVADALAVPDDADPLQLVHGLALPVALRGNRPGHRPRLPRSSFGTFVVTSGPVL
jgi:hypothetical protein